MVTGGRGLTPGEPGPAHSEEPIVWRVSTMGRVAGWVGVAAAAGLMVAAPVALLFGGDAGVALAPILAGGSLLVGLYAWRYALHPDIVADGEHLVVRNPWSRHVLRWPQIRSVEPGYNGLEISTDVLIVTAWAVQKSNLARWIGRRTRADDIAEALRHRLPESSPRTDDSGWPIF